LALERVVLDSTVIHVPDAHRDVQHRRDLAVLTGVEAILVAPLLRDGHPIGAIGVTRSHPGPFTDKQIALLKTFADQAVIAIENVRLFQELQVRNRDLTEALEQQTATSEVGVIAGSPTELQPVLDAVAERAARLCDANNAVIMRVFDERFQMAAYWGDVPESSRSNPISFPISRGIPIGRAILDRQIIHMDDLLAKIDTEYPDAREPQNINSTRTVLAAPLLREGVAIGAILVPRREVRPFSDKEIALLKTFADQAVIAIENVRLFQELQARNRDLTEALEQQTATGEVLCVIASSPTDIQPVLDVVAENAARVCGANDAVIRLVEGNMLRSVAHGSLPQSRPAESEPLDGGWIPARAVLERQTIHIHDITAVENEFPESTARANRAGVRTMLTTPLLREGIAIGVIHIRRTEVRPFTDKQIPLLKTFADQAVIAIENVRLFQELESRTRELARSVGELKALGDVGQAVSSTLDLQTVLSTIVGHAVQLSGTDGGVIYEYDESREEFELRASHRMEEEVFEALKATPIRLGQGATGQAATIQAPVQVANILEERESTPHGFALFLRGSATDPFWPFHFSAKSVFWAP
jgi:GAF domain-containing protein